MLTAFVQAMEWDATLVRFEKIDEPSKMYYKPYQTVAVQDPRASGYYLNKISGTSQATPNVTGMLACILQARPTMTPAEALTFLTQYSTKNALVQTGASSYSNTTDLQGEWKGKLDGHLKNEDFFSVEKFPTSTLVFKKIGKKFPIQRLF